MLISSTWPREGLNFLSFCVPAGIFKVPKCLHKIQDQFSFQTLLRIWDCFLLEGPKVLFRFALAILKLHEKEILQKTDTISIMRHLKAAAKLTFDADGLLKVHTM